MHKIQLTDIEKKLIKDSEKTSGLLITLFSILQLRNHPTNGCSKRDFEIINDELNELGRYVEALQRFEDPAPTVRPCICDQVQDMTYRIQLPKKVELLFQRTGFDTVIDFHVDYENDEHGNDLYDRFRDFKLKAGVEIRLVEAESPR